MAGKARGKMVAVRYGSGNARRSASGLPVVNGRLFLTCLAAFLLVVSLAGCSAPVRAPVVSRDHPPSLQQRSSKPTVYRVQKGDTLYSIAWRFGIDYASIARWNGIRYPYTIYPGQRLRLTPAVRRQVARSQTAKTPQSQGASRERKPVVSGKQVSRLAKKGVSSSQVKGKTANQSLELRWLWPTDGSVVQRFVNGDPVKKGVKIKGRYGASIKAAEAGKVVYAGSGLIGYGRLVIIKHNKNYLSAYGYNKKIHVKEGDTVKKGVRIAEMGSDGNGRPMLHFEIRRNGAPVDPLKLLPRRP